MIAGKGFVEIIKTLAHASCLSGFYFIISAEYYTMNRFIIYYTYVIEGKLLTTILIIIL